MYVFLTNCIVVGFIFSRLAVKYNRSGANIAMLGLFVFVISSYFSSSWLMTFIEVNDIRFDIQSKLIWEIVIYILMYFIGFLITTGFYFILRNLWSKKSRMNSNEILDN